jgi:uncharacterized membrane protein
MKRWAQSIFVTALGIWVGGMVVLGFIVAPTVFKTVPSRLQAGTIFGAILERFGPLQIGLAVVCLVSLIALRLLGGLPNRAAIIRFGGVALMLILVLLSHCYLAPAIVREREAIVNFDSTPSGTPQKAAFDRLHRASVRLAVATLAIGVGVLVCSGLGSKPADGA